MTACLVLLCTAVCFVLAVPASVLCARLSVLATLLFVGIDGCESSLPHASPWSRRMHGCVELCRAVCLGTPLAQQALVRMQCVRPEGACTITHFEGCLAACPGLACCCAAVLHVHAARMPPASIPWVCARMWFASVVWEPWGTVFGAGWLVTPRLSHSWAVPGCGCVGWRLC